MSLSCLRKSKKQKYTIIQITIEQMVHHTKGSKSQMKKPVNAITVVATNDWLTPLSVSLTAILHIIQAQIISTGIRASLTNALEYTSDQNPPFIAIKQTGINTAKSNN